MKAWQAATVPPRALRFKRPLHRCNPCELGSPVRESHPARRFCRPLRSLARSQDNAKLVRHPGIAPGTPVWKTGVYLTTPMPPKRRSYRANAGENSRIRPHWVGSSIPESLAEVRFTPTSVVATFPEATVLKSCVLSRTGRGHCAPVSRKAPCSHARSGIHAARAFRTGIPCAVCW